MGLFHVVRRIGYLVVPYYSKHKSYTINDVLYTTLVVHTSDDASCAYFWTGLPEESHAVLCGT